MSNQKATILFCNNGLLDINTITTMGVSIKETDAPIGFFGTGLKFAIATLLRTGHDINIFVGDKTYILSTKQQLIRGENFELVTLNGQQLGYTTQLGRNWEVWQAYRELVSNLMDEKDGTTITYQDPDSLNREAYQDVFSRFDTVIEVCGPSIIDSHRNHDKIFCASPIIQTIPGYAEIREGVSDYLFFRGVRVYKLDKPSLYTWNLLDSQDLTEDRTLKYISNAHYTIGTAISACLDYDIVVKSILAKSSEAFEGNLDMGCALIEPSDVFLKAVKDNVTKVNCNVTARKYWERITDVREVYKPLTLSPWEEEQLEMAEAICRRADPDYSISKDDLLFVADLGPSCLGLVREDKIYISSRNFDIGTPFLATTLYEEYCHRYLGLYDETRGFQNHILNRLMGLATLPLHDQRPEKCHENH